MANLQSRLDEFKDAFESKTPPCNAPKDVQKIRRTTALLSVTLLLSTLSFAQRVVTASASIPFDFSVQGQEFHAGDYVFDSGFPGSTTIRRKGSQLSVAISIIPYGDPVKKEDAKVLFVRRDGKYYLTEFWGVLDRRVVSAEFENRGQVREQQLQVPLTYP